MNQKYDHSTESNIASPWHLDAHTLDPGYDGPGVDARPQLEPLIRPVRDNKLVNVGLDIEQLFIYYLRAFVVESFKESCN